MSIKTTNLTKLYKGKKALDNISFSVKKGEIVGLLGPNGAGKSTLMKILATYLKPTTGNVWVNNFEVQKQATKVQKSIGYLPEHNPLYVDMYVREYLQFRARVYGVNKQRVELVINQTGLLPEANKKIKQLSKGYRQRVGLAATLLHKPQLLILDEPTTGLDPNQLLDIRQLIKNIGNETAVLFSTHIMQEVIAVCSRLIIINKGKIVADHLLENIDNTQIIEVAFDSNIEEHLLKQIEKVIKVENTHDFHYKISFATKQDMRASVSNFARDKGLGVLSLRRKNKNLESLFRELTAN